MSKISLWFPVAIYEENNLFDNAQNKEWANYILSSKSKITDTSSIWIGSTQSSFSTNSQLDSCFAPLIEEVTKHVQLFAQEHSSYELYKCKNSWFNINYKNTFQEFHFHQNSIFSAIYYISTPKGSSNLVFEDPKEPDMYRVKNIKTYSHLTFPRASYEAEEGKLIIFRSYLRHCVKPHNSKLPRISTAFNFV